MVLSQLEARLEHTDAEASKKGEQIGPKGEKPQVCYKSKKAKEKKQRSNG